MALAWLNAAYTRERLMRHTRVLLLVLAGFQFMWAALYFFGVADVPIYNPPTQHKVLFPYEATSAEKQYAADVTLGFAAFSFLVGVIYFVGGILKFFWFRFVLISVLVVSSAVQAWNGSISSICIGTWFLYKMTVYRNVST